MLGVKVVLISDSVENQNGSSFRHCVYKNSDKDRFKQPHEQWLRGCVQGWLLGLHFRKELKWKMVLKMTLLCSGSGRKWEKCQDDQRCDSRNMTASHLLDRN